MKITSLEISNIGPYYTNRDKVVVDLTTTSNNLIIFSGQNGAGKTSFLDIIKLSLLGSYVVGSDKKNIKYYTHVREMLNTRRLEQRTNNFILKMKYEEVQNFKNNTIEIRREFDLESNPGKIFENTTIFMNDEIVKNSDEFMAELIEKYPPKIIELFFLDGEYIMEMVNKKNLPHFIESTYDVATKASIFKNLNGRLKKYVNQQNKVLYNTTSGSYAYELQGIIERLHIESKSLEVLIIEKEAKKAEIETSINNFNSQIKNNLEQLTNLSDYDENIKLLKNTLDSDKTEDRKSIKAFLTTDSIALLNPKLVLELNQNIEFSRNLYHLAVLDKLSINQTNDEILKTVQVLKKLLSSENEKSNIFDYSEKLENSLRKHETTVVEYNKQKTQLLESFSISSNNLLKELKKNSTIITDYVEQLELEKINLDDILAELDNLKINLISINHQHHERIEELSELTSKLRETNKNKHSIEEANKINVVIEEFIKIRKNVDYHKISLAASEMFKLLNRKSEFIDKIELNGYDSQVFVYDNEGVTINYSKISAGEKQLLLLSILISIIKYTEFDFPFFLDTFLGRMDSKHKNALFKSFLPVCGEQVILFTTDEELSPKEVGKLKLSKYYILDNNGVGSTISEGVHSDK